MISLPVRPEGDTLATIFPEAVVVYRYERGTGYVRVKPDDDLAVGEGYWILLNAAKSYTLTGNLIPSYTHTPSSEWMGHDRRMHRSGSGDTLWV